MTITIDFSAILNGKLAIRIDVDPDNPGTKPIERGAKNISRRWVRWMTA